MNWETAFTRRETAFQGYSFKERGPTFMQIKKAESWANKAWREWERLAAYESSFEYWELDGGFSSLAIPALEVQESFEE